MASNTVVLRQVETDAGTTTLLAQDASEWSAQGGVMLRHDIRWRGFAPGIDEVYISPEEMDMLMAWWSQQQEKQK